MRYRTAVILASLGVSLWTAFAGRALASDKVRIFPPYRHGHQGLLGPNKHFAITRSKNGAVVLDLRGQKPRIAWTVNESPESHPRGVQGAAFSQDGKTLVTCGSHEGTIIDLITGKQFYADWLVGSRVAISSDGQKIYLICEQYPREGFSRSGGMPHKDGWIGAGIIYSNRMIVRDRLGKITAEYPLSLNVVSRVSLSRDGKTITLTGGVGRNLRACRQGPFTPGTETIQLPGGQSKKVMQEDKTREGGRRTGNDFGRSPFTKPRAGKIIPPYPGDLNYLQWNPVSQTLGVVMGSGDERDWRMYLWSLKDAEMKTMVPLGYEWNRSAPVPMGRTGQWIGLRRWKKAEQPNGFPFWPKHQGQHGILDPVFPTVVSLPDGKLTPLAIDATLWQEIYVSPDGKTIAGLIPRKTLGVPYERSCSLEIYDLDRALRLGTVRCTGTEKIVSVQWSGGGKHLSLIRYDHEKNSGVYKRSLVGLSGRPVATFTHPSAERWKAMNPSATRFAETVCQGVNISGQDRTDVPAVIIRDRKGKEVSRIKLKGGHFYGWCHFVTDQQLLLLIADRAELWDIEKSKQLWTSPVPGPMSPKIVNTTQDQWLALRGDTPTILRTRDGQPVVVGKKGRWRRAAHTNSRRGDILVGQRPLILQPVFQQTVVELKSPQSGQIVATLAMSGKHWAIYTPDGHWTGSKSAATWLGFYRGSNPMAEREIQSLRNPKHVKRVLSTALYPHRTTSKVISLKK
jgi:hypothetical protein